MFVDYLPDYYYYYYYFVKHLPWGGKLIDGLRAVGPGYQILLWIMFYFAK